MSVFARKKKEEPREYKVEGKLVFTYKVYSDEPRSSSSEQRERLLEVIRGVDHLYPWKDMGYKNPWDSTESLLPSIGNIRFLADQFNNWSPPELSVWVSITPTLALLRKGQIHAYVNYLETLAGKLASRDQFAGIATVRSVCGFIKSSHEFVG